LRVVSFTIWLLRVVSFNMWLISSLKDSKCCYKLSKCTNWHSFHSKCLKLSFWGKIVYLFWMWFTGERSWIYSSTVQQPTTNGKIPKSRTDIVEGLSSSRVSKVHSPAFPRLCVHCKIDRTAFLVACLTQFTYGVYS
jgi:hypothetical protein